MSCIFLSRASTCLWLRAHLYPGQGMQNTLPCNPLVACLFLPVSKFLFVYWVRHSEEVPLHSFGRMQDPGCRPSLTHIICQAWHAEQAVLLSGVTRLFLFFLCLLFSCVSEARLAKEAALHSCSYMHNLGCGLGLTCLPGKARLLAAQQSYSLAYSWLRLKTYQYPRQSTAQEAALHSLPVVALILHVS